MNDIEKMKKINDIFLEGIMNDTLDVYEGTELIYESNELFNPEYMCESEELDDDEYDDLDGEDKEETKKTRKKIIIAIAAGTAALTSITALIVFYKKSGDHSKVKECEKKKTLITECVDKLKKLKHKLKFTKDDLQRINKLGKCINDAIDVSMRIDFFKRKFK